VAVGVTGVTGGVTSVGLTGVASAGWQVVVRGDPPLLVVPSGQGWHRKSLGTPLLPNPKKAPGQKVSEMSLAGLVP
jgi:hypothetical protein